MKSSAPDEASQPLGAPIRDVRAVAPREPQAVDARGTIFIDSDGKLSTQLPLPPPDWAEICRRAVADVAIRKTDTDMPIEFWGMW